MLTFFVVSEASAQTEPTKPEHPKAEHVKAELTLQEMAALSAAVSPEITLKVTQTDKEIVLSYGPFDLPANVARHGNAAEPPPRWVTIPDDAWIHGYWVEMIDKHGAKVPSSTLHHVNVIATQQRELFSPIMLRIAAASSETEPVKLPRFFGLDAKKGDTLLVRALMHNPTEKDYQGARILVHFPVTKRNSTIGSRRIQPFYLDVTAPAGPHAFDIPPGSSEQFWETKPAITVKILGMTGHVRKYATSMRFEDRTTGKTIWKTKIDTTANGEPKTIPLERFIIPLGKEIRADHTYRLTVVYSNPTRETIVNGGMGTLGGVVLVAGDVKWPVVDHKDPEFKMDQRAMWRP